MTPMKMNVLTIAVVLVASLGFAAGVLVPGLRDLDRKHIEIATEQQTLKERQNEVGDVSAVYQDLMALSEEVSDFRQRLPNERQSGEFMDDLTKALMSCDIQGYFAQPEPGLRISPDRLPEHLKLAAETEILPVKVTFEAEFRDAFKFIDKLESMPRLVYIEQVDMKTPSDDVGRLSVSMIVHAYHHNHKALGIFDSKGILANP
jgi:Tfp pilus assembly protein PilO